MHCSPTKNNNAGSNKLPAFDLQGHRGCRGLLPENTIVAMLKAIDLKVTTLEMDVVITADSQVVLSHEPFFNHDITTKPNGEAVTAAEEKDLNIYKMTLEQVQDFDVGLKPHPRFPRQEKLRATKPLLSQVFEVVTRYCTAENHKPIPFFNIETKTQPATDNRFHPEPGRFVELLMNVVKKTGMEDRVVVQSFDFRTLQYLHGHYPNIKTAALIEQYDRRSFRDLMAALGFVPTIFSPAHELVTPELVRQTHAAEVKLIPWTVNDAKTAKALILMGVDGLITDYPNLVTAPKQ
jgi:glycerophosphoryl diester phosphodiesterase